MKIFNGRKNVLTYTVDKEYYFNNASISVQNGEVVVCAPWYLTSSQIQKIVEEKREWILNKLRNCAIENEYRSTFILGKKYPIIIKFNNVKRAELNLKKDKIEIILPLSYNNKNIDRIVSLVLKKMYLKISENKLEEIMEKTRIKLGFAPEDYEVKELNHKMADCINMKKIFVNPEIMKYNQSIIEYIIMHEFCHLKYKTHCKKFYDLVKTHMPKYHQFAEQIIHLIY